MFEWSECCFEAFSPQKKKKNPGGNTGLKCLWSCHLLCYKMMWEGDQYGLKELVRFHFHHMFFPHLHLSGSVSICVVVSSLCAPSDCDARGQKSTASCLDFNMVLSVLASLKKKKKTKNFLYQPYHYSNFVSKPLRQFCTQTVTCKCCSPPLGAIFVAIKKQSSCATWNTFCVWLIWSFWLWSERNDLSETIWLFSPT